MSSIVLTQQQYLTVVCAREYQVQINPRGRMGYGVTPVLTDVAVRSKTVSTALTLGLPPPVIHTWPSRILAVNGRYPYYNNCFHYGIKNDFTLFLSSIKGQLLQLDSDPYFTDDYVYLHGETYPDSGYVSFVTPSSDTFAVKVPPSPVIQYVTADMFSVWCASRVVHAPAGDVLLPSVRVSGIFHDIDGNYYYASRPFDCKANESSLVSVAYNVAIEPWSVSDLMKTAVFSVIRITPKLSEKISDDQIMSVTQWAERLNLEALVPQLLDAERANFPEVALAKEAFKSFRVKDATLLRELMDTMAGLSGLIKLSSAIPGLEVLKSAFKDESLRGSLKTFSSLYLAGKYGVEMSVKNLIAWLDSYDNLSDKLDKQLFPTALRAIKVGAVSSKGIYGLSGSGKWVMSLGITTFGDWRDYINAFYRWGLALSISDGWDLVPLSFVVDWVWSGVQAFAQSLSLWADSYRLSVSYCCRSSKFDLDWRCAGPSSLEPFTVHLPVHSYRRIYSNEVPSLHFWETLTQESMAGTLNISSLPSLVAILVSFLT